jgi:hypothetical protein
MIPNTRRTSHLQTNDTMGDLLYGGFASLLKWFLMLGTLSFLIVNLHHFTSYYHEEAAIIEDARRIYEKLCSSGDATDARLFHGTCRSASISITKNAAWEAIARVARRNQMCGETGCSTWSFYLIGGVFIGVILIIMILPRISAYTRDYIDAMQEEEMRKKLYSSSSQYFENDTFTQTGNNPNLLSNIRTSSETGNRKMKMV